MLIAILQRSPTHCSVDLSASSTRQTKITVPPRLYSKRNKGTYSFGLRIRIKTSRISTRSVNGDHSAVAPPFCPNQKWVSNKTKNHRHKPRRCIPKLAPLPSSFLSRRKCSLSAFASRQGSNIPPRPSPSAAKPPRLVDAFSSRPALLTPRDPKRSTETRHAPPNGENVREWNGRARSEFQARARAEPDGDVLGGGGGAPLSLSPLQLAVPTSTRSAALLAWWPPSFPRVQKEAIVPVSLPGGFATPKEVRPRNFLPCLRPVLGRDGCKLLVDGKLFCAKSIFIRHSCTATRRY